MNNPENQKAINDFIDWVCEISDCVNSDNWQGEDVMGIFFNEFNRYKKKTDAGQVEKGTATAPAPAAPRRRS